MVEGLVKALPSRVIEYVRESGPAQLFVLDAKRTRVVGTSVIHL